MKWTNQNLVGDIVAQNKGTASIFSKHKIDFCCGGRLTIEKACELNGVDLVELLGELEKCSEENIDANEDFNSMNLNDLIDYIEKNHHKYVEEKSQELMGLLQKLVQVHGNKHPELFRLQTIVQDSIHGLAQHMKKEELILFPYVRKLVYSMEVGELIKTPAFGSIANPIQVMMQEHEMEGSHFNEISDLTNNYTPPEDACQTYRYTFQLLQEFESDLHQHIHLENNILFPKAIEMEQLK